MIALRSNIRWCSDRFELACRNGEIVRVLFAIDACDREVIGWLATSAGISGEMVRDLMVACVERQFGISKAAHPVEWLSDGSAYIAKDTLDTATALGLKLCFTPVRSPQSNGIAEAFVKTFKRDYARLSILPDAETVIALLPAWFEDYNEVHPHSGLKFLSPREFLRLVCLAQPATCPVKRGAHQSVRLGVSLALPALVKTVWQRPAPSQFSEETFNLLVRHRCRFQTCLRKLHAGCSGLGFRCTTLPFLSFAGSAYSTRPSSSSTSTSAKYRQCREPPRSQRLNSTEDKTSNRGGGAPFSMRSNFANNSHH